VQTEGYGQQWRRWPERDVEGVVGGGASQKVGGAYQKSGRSLSKKWAWSPEKGARLTEKWACPGVCGRGQREGRGLGPWPLPSLRLSPGGDYAKDTPIFDKKGLCFALR